MTAGGLVRWMALSLICTAIRSKSEVVMTPESEESRDFTESTTSEMEASATPDRARSRNSTNPENRDRWEKSMNQ
jgi:hypothetical protein